MIDNLAKARGDLISSLKRHIGRPLHTMEVDLVDRLVDPDILEFAQAFIDEARVALVKDLGEQHISTTRIRVPSTAHNID